MAQSASKTCEICVSAPGSHYCLDCQQLYCANCKSLHKRQKLSTNHQFQNASKRIPEGKSRCSEHKEELYFMCNTCNVLVCASCVTGKHNGHKLSKLVDVIAQLRDENKTQIQGKTNEEITNKRKIEESLESFDQAVASVIKAITDEGSKIKRMVDTSVAQMIASIKEQSQTEKDKLINMLSDAKSVLAAGQKLDRRRQELAKTRHDGTLVHEMNNLKEKINKIQINDLPNFPKIVFNRKHVAEDDIMQLIGTFNLSNCSPVLENEVQSHGYQYICPNCRYETIDSVGEELCECCARDAPMDFIKEV